jgi:hypothetical protein
MELEGHQRIKRPTCGPYPELVQSSSYFQILSLNYFYPRFVPRSPKCSPSQGSTNQIFFSTCITFTIYIIRMI